jgi:hypothetical protein
MDIPPTTYGRVKIAISTVPLRETIAMLAGALAICPCAGVEPAWASIPLARVL